MLLPPLLSLVGVALAVLLLLLLLLLLLVLVVVVLGSVVRCTGVAVLLV